jgi:hypothetical protein
MKRVIIRFPPREKIIWFNDNNKSDADVSNCGSHPSQVTTENDK